MSDGAVFEPNKTEPYIFSGKYQAMGDIGQTYWYKAYFMTRKFKGGETATYTSKGEAVVVAVDRVPKKHVTEKMIERAQGVAKAGRYYDWTWQPRPTGTVAIFAPPPKSNVVDNNGAGNNLIKEKRDGFTDTIK